MKKWEHGKQRRRTMKGGINIKQKMEKKEKRKKKKELTESSTIARGDQFPVRKTSFR